MMEPFKGISDPVVAHVISSAASADEKNDNPEYVGWYKFDLGSSTTVKMATVSNGDAHEMLKTTKLIEKAAEKLVFEVTLSFVFPGRRYDSPTIKWDVPKKFGMPNASKPDKLKIEEGTETLTIGGAELNCKWAWWSAEIAGVESESKIWICDEVPGRLAKVDTNYAVGNAPVNFKLDLIEFKKA